MDSGFISISGIMGGFSVLLAFIVVNTPPVRSRLKSPTMRSLGAGVLAAVTILVADLIQRLVSR